MGPSRAHGPSAGRAEANSLPDAKVHGPRGHCTSCSPLSVALVSLYGHENSVMTERVRSQVQISKLRLLRKIKEVTLLTRSTSLAIRKSLEPLISKLKDLSLDGLVM